MHSLLQAHLRVRFLLAQLFLIHSFWFNHCRSSQLQLSLVRIFLCALQLSHIPIMNLFTTSTQLSSIQHMLVLILISISFSQKMKRKESKRFPKAHSSELFAAQLWSFALLPEWSFSSCGMEKEKKKVHIKYISKI